MTLCHATRGQFALVSSRWCRDIVKELVGEEGAHQVSRLAAVAVAAVMIGIHCTGKPLDRINEVVHGVKARQVAVVHGQASPLIDASIHHLAKARASHTADKAPWHDLE